MGMHPVWFDLLYLFVIIFVINYICDFKKKIIVHLCIQVSSVLFRNHKNDTERLMT